MDGLTKTGTVIFAISLGIIGVLHFIMGQSIAADLPSFFFAPILWIYFSGFALIAASISILIKKYTRLACLLLALLFFILVLTVDLPRFFNETATFILVFFTLKDIAIAGASLVIAAASSRPESL